MALWFLRGLRRGVVTTRYPAAVDAWASALPTPPRFVPSRLSVERADRLVDVCPSGALRREDAALVVDLGRCTACGRCMLEAPSVVQPSGVWELAATDRHALVKWVPIRGGAR